MQYFLTDLQWFGKVSEISLDSYLSSVIKEIKWVLFLLCALLKNESTRRNVWFEKTMFLDNPRTSLSTVFTGNTFL